MSKQKKFSFLEDLGATLRVNKIGELVFRKLGLTRERVKTDPCFENTLKNGVEFGRASKTGRLIRSALHPWTSMIADSQATGRLTKQLLSVLRAGKTNPRGERTVRDGDLTLLEGFEFNKLTELNGVYVDCRVSPGKTGLKMKTQIPAHNSELNRIGTTFGGSHYLVTPLIVVINSTENRYYVYPSIKTQPLSIETKAVEEMVVNVPAIPAKKCFYIAVLAIEFYTHVNGCYHFLHNAGCNSLKFIKAGRI